MSTSASFAVQAQKMTNARIMLGRKYCLLSDRIESSCFEIIKALTTISKRPRYTDTGRLRANGTFDTIICIDDLPDLKYSSIAKIPVTQSNCGMKWPSRMEDVLGMGFQCFLEIHSSI
jgi:hypothetical protein